MATAVYPGSFDPVTKGHLDIIERAASLVDELVVAVLKNNAKTPLFSEEERVKFAKQCGAKFIVRGLRAVTDFEYELQMAQTNRSLCSEVDTLFFATELNYAYISSTITKEIGSYGGDISGFVPEQLVDQVYEKIASRQKKENR